MDPTDRLILAQTGGGARVGTARDHIGAIRGGRSTLLAWFATQARARFFTFDERVGGAVRAVVNHGHWIVRCPWCPGAEEADPGEPVFYCLSCGNGDVGGKVLQVEFPPAREREVLEALLLRRNVANRNWEGETNAQMLQENFEHGVK